MNGQAPGQISAEDVKSEQWLVDVSTEAPIPTFGAETLMQVSTFGEMAANLASTEAPDCSFQHAQPTGLDLLRSGMQYEQNLFGPGTCAPVYRRAQGMMRGVTSSVLHHAIYSGQSTSIQSLARGFFEPSVTLMTEDGRLTALAGLEPFYQIGADGFIRATSSNPPVEMRDEIAVPICGVGFHNYGHFLYDGLPAALLYRHSLPGLPLRFVGNELAGWQSQLMDLLGLLDDYRVVTQPAGFTRILASDLLSLHVSYPTRFARLVFDTLRFLVGGPANRRTRTIFLSRRSDTSRRIVTNRDEVETALAAAGVEVVQPELMTVLEQIALAASCRFIIGEGGAGMANVGFCDPGTSVLEIQHEHAPDGWTRAACRIMGLNWHLFSAQADDSAAAADPRPRADAFMKIDVSSLLSAVQTIKSRL